MTYYESHIYPPPNHHCNSSSVLYTGITKGNLIGLTSSRSSVSAQQQPPSQSQQNQSTTASQASLNTLSSCESNICFENLTQKLKYKSGTTIIGNINFYGHIPTWFLFYNSLPNNLFVLYQPRCRWITRIECHWRQSGPSVTAFFTCLASGCLRRPILGPRLGCRIRRVSYCCFNSF